MKIKLFVLFGIIIILYSCKKNTYESPKSELTNIASKAKMIYEKELGKNTTNNQLGLVPFTNLSDIKWNETYKDPSTNLLITPIETKANQKSQFSSHRFLVIDLSKNSSKYYTVITDKEIPKEKVSSLMNNEESVNQDIKAIFCYGIDNKPLDNLKASRGDKIHELKSKSSAKTPLVLGKDEELPEGIAPAPGEGGGTSVCVVYTINWYWQTWENGVLVSEEYMYSTSQTYCTAGGSGGGGSGGGNVNCTQLYNNFMNMGQATNGSITYIDIPMNNQATRYERSYNWPIFTAGTWGLLSYEKAVLDKVYYPSNNTSRFEFTSFVHTRIAETGVNIGGTRTFTDIGTSINISSPRTRADIQVDFSVTSTLVSNYCPGSPPLTIPYNATKFFIAPNTIVLQ